jgi:hypothetical protein
MVIEALARLAVGVFAFLVMLGLGKSLATKAPPPLDLPG